MTVYSWESYLLLITLIIASVSLFLCLFNTLLLFDVSKRLTRLMSRSSLPKKGKGQMAIAATSPDRIKSRIPFQENEDIVTGIRIIAKKNHIDSLVVAMPDGLVVASAGSNDPEYDAAHYSSLFTGGYTTPEPGIWLFPLDHRGIPLIGIARSRDSLPDEMKSRITEDLKLLFERGL